MNKLRNMRCYLGGAIEAAADCGVAWRQKLKKAFHDYDIIWLDPCNKPIDLGFEDIENHERRKQLKKEGKFDQVAKEMRIVRCVDLRMIDISDFLIFNVDVDVHTCGTYEEITLANRQKKPIIVRVKQGKWRCPDWLLGMLPHEMIFGNWEQVSAYLHEVSVEGSKERWMFFDFHGDGDVDEPKVLSLEYASVESRVSSLESGVSQLALRVKRLEASVLSQGLRLGLRVQSLEEGKT